ncbi:T9SS type A sorting domain-containing protein [Psychroserpens luteolus]|uniref:T9SS type A sorting domain-containing protein n=1 Tax=Psychroserpens luteolus TaxID=2855840 RepID=UPI001E37BE22|nr:T9SS type A sorting domain-containing protein [Psychroserpens luteolus]MCD2259478.1 T9SS type A sorting domain-containing protein [Psychroserpens luteolus]
MIKKLCLTVFACALTFQSLSAQENFKLMFYNLLNFPLEDAVPNRLQYLELVLDDYRPDLFMVCELNNVNGANTILSSLQFINPDYQGATFELNTSDDSGSNQNDLQQLLYYDSSKFILESQNIVTTIFRDFNHYRLRLNSVNQNTNPVILDVIVCHLKASQGTTNQNLRLQMVNDLTTYLDTFPVNSNIVLAGDFNVYTSSEPAFQELIDTANNNVIKFEDPADRIGSWHTNSNFIDVMTQSTRTQTGLGGSTGGFDDRFDFIMTSAFMNSNPELTFVLDSYDVYGNNENFQCFNQEINSSDCAGADFSFAIRDALYNFSDHLPVTLELQTNQSLSVDEILVEDAITIIGTNVVDETLKLKVKPSLENNISLSIYNSLGQLVKTVNAKNSLITVDATSFANGIYYITSSKFQFEPLKFVVAH